MYNTEILLTSSKQNSCSIRSASSTWCEAVSFHL